MAAHRHQHLSFFEGQTGTYYPMPENSAARYYGATTAINDWVFGDGAGGNDSAKKAVIRAIHVMNTSINSSPWPVVPVYDGAGNTVLQFPVHRDASSAILHGPHGIELPGGFYCEISGADGAYMTIVYDVA